MVCRRCPGLVASYGMQDMHVLGWWPAMVCRPWPGLVASYGMQAMAWAGGQLWYAVHGLNQIRQCKQAMAWACGQLGYAGHGLCWWPAMVCRPWAGGQQWYAVHGPSQVMQCVRRPGPGQPPAVPTHYK